MNQLSKNYDLEERTAKFGETIIKFCRTLKQDSISSSIIHQLVHSSTSIGANYMETNGASSKKDFQHKISICKKEAQETKHWLRMLATCLKESQELTLIFQKITSSLRNRA